MKFIITLFLIGIELSVFAQNEADALRYSRLNYMGTARYVSLGGAYGALGGDVSALSVNPGGIGVFRKSEFTFTPSLFNNNTNTIQSGNASSDYKLNLNIGNLGYVYTAPVKSTSKWKSTTFGITYSRTNSFQERYSTHVASANSSFLDQYTTNLNTQNYNSSNIATNPDFKFGTNLAWQTFLVDVDTLTNTYFHPLQQYGEQQNSTTTTSGAMGETVFSYGANYDNKWFFGASLGYANIKYNYTFNYSEVAAATDTLTNLNSFTYNEKLKTKGYGFNLKMGAIYRANDYIRLGLAFHSPTVFSLNDTWNSNITANFKTVNNSENSPLGQFSYNLTTPARAIASVAFLLGKKGLITAEYDYVGYGTARLHSSSSAGRSSYNFSSENSAIKNSYKNVGNIKLGAEWRLNQNYSLRGGFSYYADPLKNKESVSLAIKNYSGGFGYRNGDFFMDFAYQMSYGKDINQLYDSSLITPSIISSYSSSIMGTIGVRF